MECREHYHTEIRALAPGTTGLEAGTVLVIGLLVNSTYHTAVGFLTCLKELRKTRIEEPYLE